MPSLSREFRFAEYHGGQSLVEYGLCIGLVVLLALVGLQALGVNLNVCFTNMIPDPKAAVAASPSAATLPVSGTSVTIPPAGSGGGGTKGSSVVKASDYTVRMAGTVATLGANGTTFELSSQLKAIADKLRSSGEITDAEANKLVALANQGFRLAELEKKVEEASKRSGSTQGFLQSSIQFDGKSYTMPEVAGLIGFGTPTDLTQDIKNNSNYMLETSNASPETLAFITLYQDAISGANIQNSEAKGIVSQLSSEISYLTDAVSNLIYGAYDPNISLENLNKNTASQASVYDSTAICYIGNGACGG